MTIHNEKAKFVVGMKYESSDHVIYTLVSRTEKFVTFETNCGMKIRRSPLNHVERGEWVGLRTSAMLRAENAISVK